MSTFHPSRRQFLMRTTQGLAALALARTLPACALSASEDAATDDAAVSADQGLRTRRSWHALSAEEKALYRKAVVLLNAERVETSQYQPYATEFQRLAYVHNQSCPHGNWFFLPWHRVYLAYYEAALRRVLRKANVPKAETFALPYWDWTEHPQIPDEFWDSDLDPARLHKGSPSLATARGIKKSFVFPTDEESPIGAESIRKILASKNFYVFGSYPSLGLHGVEDRRAHGKIEGMPHNYVHGTIGGLMGAFLSPADPIFWLHHCNIDRLWNQWMIRRRAQDQDILPFSPNAIKPTSGLQRKEIFLEGIKGSYEDYWKTFPLELRADTGSVKDPDIVHTGTTAADVLDSTKAILRKGREGQPVAYRYDTDLRSRSASPSLPQSEARTSDEFRADFGVVEVPPGQSAFIATLSEPKAASVLTPFVQGVADALFVSVDKLPVPTDEELRNAVELVLRVSEGDATTAPSTIVGTLSFFDMHDARGNASHDHVTALTQLSRAFLVEVSDVFDNPRRAPSGPLRITGTLRVKKGIPEPAGWSAFRAEWRLLVRDPASALEVTLVATR